MHNCSEDKERFNKILSTKDDLKKLIKLSDFMLKVEVGSYFWNEAKKESQRLQKNGIDFGC